MTLDWFNRNNWIFCRGSASCKANTQTITKLYRFQHTVGSHGIALKKHCCRASLFSLSTRTNISCASQINLLWTVQCFPYWSRDQNILLWFSVPGRIISSWSSLIKWNWKPLFSICPFSTLFGKWCITSPCKSFLSWWIKEKKHQSEK